MAQIVKANVSSGEYVTESEVIRDAAVEKWLRDEVVPTYDEMKAHPERALSAEEVRRGLDARMAVHAKK